MIKLERFEVMNFENAMRGARNPLNSWARMDSKTENGVFTFGPNDLDLAKRLCKAGSDHRKFIRQIFVTVDITAPFTGGRNTIHIRLEQLPIQQVQCIKSTASHLKWKISALTIVLLRR